MTERSLANLKPFKKGDERINRKGRPREFDVLRAIARRIADEKVSVTVEGKTFEMTRAEVILRQWAMSKNPQSQEKFITVAYGKVPDEIVINPDSRVTVNVRYIDDDGQPGRD